MTSRANPNGSVCIRKYLIRRKLILIRPHLGNIRIFVSQTIKTRKNFPVIAIRTIRFTIYNIDDSSRIITVTSRASPSGHIGIRKNMIS